MRWRLVLLLTLAAGASVRGAENRKDIVRLDGTRIAAADIDATVARLMNAAEVTGVGLAVLNNGKVVYAKAYGVRDKDKNLPLTADSVLAGASFTKVAFTHLVLQLVDERRIDLDSPVTRQLPKPLAEYPAYQDLAGDPRHLKITPRMLLSHTGGFPNFRQLNADRRLNINFEPGTRYAYSGEGMQLLQLVVETVTGRSLGDLMRERVFAPFGMTRTSMISESRFAGDLAHGYDEYGRSLGAQVRARPDAAGSMQTTLNDFTRFVQAVLAGKRLRRATRDLMLAPQIEIVSAHQFPTLDRATTDENKAIRLSYGLGWGLYFTPYGRAFFKEGHDSGFRNYAVVFERSGTGLVVMTNSSNGEAIFKQLLETVLKNTFTPIAWEGFTPYDALPPRPPLPAHQEIALDPGTLDRYVGRYALAGDVLTVMREGSRLFFQENDQPRVEIFAEADRRFFSKVADDVFTFEGGEGGRAATMVVHSGGRDVAVKRVE